MCLIVVPLTDVPRAMLGTVLSFERRFNNRGNNNRPAGQRSFNNRPVEQVANVNTFDDDSSDSYIGLRGLYSRYGQVYALDDEGECKCVKIDFEINRSRLTGMFDTRRQC